MMDETLSGTLEEEIYSGKKELRGNELAEYQAEQMGSMATNIADSVKMRETLDDISNILRGNLAAQRFQTPILRVLYKAYLTLENRGIEQLLEGVNSTVRKQQKLYEHQRRQVSAELYDLQGEQVTLLKELEGMKTAMERHDAGISATVRQIKELDALINAREAGIDPSSSVTLSALPQSDYNMGLADLKDKRNDLEGSVNSGKMKIYDVSVDVHEQDLKLEEIDFLIGLKKGDLAECSEILNSIRMGMQPVYHRIGRYINGRIKSTEMDIKTARAIEDAHDCLESIQPTLNNLIKGAAKRRRITYSSSMRSSQSFATAYRSMEEHANRGEDYMDHSKANSEAIFGKYLR